MQLHDDFSFLAVNRELIEWKIKGPRPGRKVHQPPQRSARSANACRVSDVMDKMTLGIANKN
jgi:hypothetical protein